MLWARRNSQDLVRRGIVKLYPRLHRYCLVLTADPVTADDLAQAACVRAIERANQFKANTHLDRWVLRITQRLWIDEVRKQTVRKGGGLLNLNEVDLVDLSPDPEASLLNREVLLAVMQLPEAQRITVFLVYGEGYSYKDAAQVLKIPVGTVMSRLATARRKLVEQYRDCAKAG